MAAVETEGSQGGGSLNRSKTERRQFKQKEVRAAEVGREGSQSGGSLNRRKSEWRQFKQKEVREAAV